MLPNIADVRDIGSLELGLALGVSGVVGGGVPRGGANPLVRVRYCFSVPGTPNWSNKKKCLTLIFKVKEQNIVFTRLPCAQKVRGRW